MRSMFFKNLLIADIQKHTARYVTFQPGLNVITSTENHVGKSSAIKSLYNTMGADVRYDSAWNKNTKLSAVTVDINSEEYRFVRYLKKYAVFKSEDLLLLTDSVSKELAPMLEKLFNFSVYLAEKKDTKKIVQAPPAFTFMPYFIDQDYGWSELYGSFERLDQFTKPERAKSLFFHLGMYTKSRIENQAKKDTLKETMEGLKIHDRNLIVTLEFLIEEMQNLIPADNLNELESHLAAPRKEVETIVQMIGKIRNRIQELQTTLQQHEYQLGIIKQNQKNHRNRIAEAEKIPSSHVCPKCGYEFDEELYLLVRSNYNQSNEDYLVAQIELIIKTIRADLKEQEKEYIALMTDLKQHEKVYDESQDAYDAYLRHKGLADTVRKYQQELVNNQLSLSEIERDIKKIDIELKKIPNRKEIEETYISYVKENILALGAWDVAFEGKIKILKALDAQGSLLPKIILSQYIGLFQTMTGLASSVIRFPFVVDSPRGKESSNTSSKEILAMIAKLSMLPQVIVATVDYDRFNINSGKNPHIIRFNEKFKLLNEETYNMRKTEIESLYDLLKAN